VSRAARRLAKNFVRTSSTQLSSLTSNDPSGGT
jgi:hypothetical protein